MPSKIPAGSFAAEPDKKYSPRYETPWDAEKQVGCKCDAGFRGPDCSLQECPSGPDVMGGDGSTKGRDCSGRGESSAYLTRTVETRIDNTFHHKQTNIDAKPVFSKGTRQAQRAWIKKRGCSVF